MKKIFRFSALLMILFLVTNCKRKWVDETPSSNLGKPSELSLEEKTPYSVKLTWIVEESYVSDIDKFLIDRKKGDEDWAKYSEITKTNTATFEWTDIAVLPENTYKYRIASEMDDQLSDTSDIVTYVTKFKPLSLNLELSADNNQIEVSWTNGTDRKNGFEIDKFQVLKGINYLSLSVVSQTEDTVFIDTDINYGQIHRYKVCAFYVDTETEEEYKSKYVEEYLDIPFSN